MTPRVHVYKIGPFENGTSIYVPIGSEASLDMNPVEATNDLDGLRSLASQHDGVVLVCSLELADAAQELGFPVEQLPGLFENSRIATAMQFAQGDDLDEVSDPWAYLRLMGGLTDFIEANVMTRWPSDRPFDIKLDGDRHQSLAGLLSAEPIPSITLVGSSNEATALAVASPIEREQRLASIDHLTVHLETPPTYALTAIHGFYKIDRMPRLSKWKDGKSVRVTEEDAFLVGGVFAALARMENIEQPARFEVSSPGRTVQTLVAGLPTG